MSHQDPVGDAAECQMVSSDAVTTTVNMTCSGGTVESGKCNNCVPTVGL